MSMWRMDFFPKFIDSAMTKRTNFGAIVSISMVIAAITLCWSETWAYLRPPLKEQLVSVSDLGGALSELVISFNFTVAAPCALIHLDVFEIVGTPNSEAKTSLFKTRLYENGTEIQTNVVAGQCGSCYGATTQERKCCASCEEVITAYQQKGWGIGSLKDWAQCKEEGIMLNGNELCRAYGSLNVNAIEGTFHIAPGINVMNQWGHQHDFSPLVGQLNLTHSIDHLTFGAPLKPSPLDHTRAVQLEPGEFHYRYNLKAVPTVVTNHFGKTMRGFQYTANFAQIPVKMAARFGPGLFFAYTFAPVAVVIGPDRVGLATYIARCVSIVGGAFMLARLVDSFGFRLNTLEGKMRIGKGE
jgi:hypothetical protein